jgi:hydroxypyruvate isomerase
MERRSFIQKTGLASLLVGSSAANTLAQAPPANSFKQLYAPHIGMFANSAGPNPIDQINFMADNGFRGLEDNELMSRPIDLQTKIGETLAKRNMTMGVFVISFDKWPPTNTLTSGSKEWRDTFLTTCKNALEVAKRVNAKHMTVVPGNFSRDLPMGLQTAHLIETLKYAKDIFEPSGKIMVLEPLSDNPDLFLRHSDQTYAICTAVNSPSCKILYDIYHMQRNEGNLIKNIERCWEQIAYFQIGDNPGRNEPTSGEINYKNVFKYIYNKGYRGVLGMEHSNAFPNKEGEQRLISAYHEVDNF